MTLTPPNRRQRFKALFAESPYTLGEEIAHAATHGAGAALSLVGLFVLLDGVRDHGGGLTAEAAAAVYGLSLVILFASSAFYHGLPRGRAKEVFLVLDHCAIYLLIAGTVTPFALISMDPAIGVPLSITIWTLAGVGVALKTLAEFWPRFRPIEPWIAIPLYLGMGWMGLFWGEGVFGQLPPAGVFWLVTGGLLYTGGVAIYLLRALPLNHTVWHLFVLAAAAAHFHAIYSYVLPDV